MEAVRVCFSWDLSCSLDNAVWQILLVCLPPGAAVVAVRVEVAYRSVDQFISVCFARVP